MENCSKNTRGLTIQNTRESTARVCPLIGHPYLIWSDLIWSKTWSRVAKKHVKPFAITGWDQVEIKHQEYSKVLIQSGKQFHGKLANQLFVDRKTIELNGSCSCFRTVYRSLLYVHIVLGLHAGSNNSTPKMCGKWSAFTWSRKGCLSTRFWIKILVKFKKKRNKEKQSKVKNLYSILSVQIKHWIYINLNV